MVVPYDLTLEGGVKRHAFNLAAELRRGGDEVWLLGSSSVGGELAPYTVGLRGIVNIFSNGSANYIGIWTCPYQVIRFLRQHKFDIIHVQEPLVPTLPYYMIWFSPGIPKVCTFHGYNEDENGRSRRARRFWSALSFPFYDRGIAVSTPAERFARLTWKKPLAIIPNGVPTHVYAPEISSESNANRPLRLLFLSHWRDPRKGFAYLLEAYRRLRENGLAVTLDVVGSGNGEPPPAMPGLTFHGPINQEALLAEHYRRADVFVATATGQESFGIVLLEAMSSGKPVVCSDIEGYRQVIHPDGARVVPPADPESLAREIADLAVHRELWRPMGEVNRRRAEEFDWARLAGRVRVEYELAIEDRRARRARKKRPTPVHA